MNGQRDCKYCRGENPRCDFCGGNGFFWVKGDSDEGATGVLKGPIPHRYVPLPIAKPQKKKRHRKRASMAERTLRSLSAEGHTTEGKRSTPREPPHNGTTRREPSSPLILKTNLSKGYVGCPYCNYAFKAQLIDEYMVECRARRNARAKSYKDRTAK